jgi:hypothetical protein
VRQPADVWEQAGQKRKCDGDIPEHKVKLKCGRGKGGKSIDQSNMDDGEGQCWSDEEKTKLFTYLLSVDNDKMFVKLRDYKRQAIEQVCRQFLFAGMT